jgi:hypothetical protein
MGVNRLLLEVPRERSKAASTNLWFYRVRINTKTTNADKERFTKKPQVLKKKCT